MGDEEEQESEEFAEERVVSKATIKAVSRRKIMVKILKFLYENNEPFYIKQITQGIANVTESAVQFNVRKLLDAGLVRRSLCSIDKTRKYFEIASRKDTEIVLRRYLWLCGFKLAKYIPLSGGKIYVSDLKENEQFNQLLDKLGLSWDEAIESLTLNTRKVEPVYSDGSYQDRRIVAFRRKEQ